MYYFFAILTGVVGGILGGLGLGGGTILIPMLTMILGIGQKQAQLINILSFVVMAGIVVIFYIKSGLVSVFPAIIFAIIGGVLSCIFAGLVKDMSSEVLTKLFGLFLIVFAVIEAGFFVVKKNQKH